LAVAVLVVVELLMALRLHPVDMEALEEEALALGHGSLLTQLERLLL
jgi:hypothetical protein